MLVRGRHEVGSRHGGAISSVLLLQVRVRGGHYTSGNMAVVVLRVLNALLPHQPPYGVPPFFPLACNRTWCW